MLELWRVHRKKDRRAVGVDVEEEAGEVREEGMQEMVSGDSEKGVEEMVSGDRTEEVKEKKLEGKA